MSETLELYGFGDDIPTCPKCGARSVWDGQARTDGDEQHTCPECDFAFLVTLDDDDDDDDEGSGEHAPLTDADDVGYATMTDCRFVVCYMLMPDDGRERAIDHGVDHYERFQFAADAQARYTELLQRDDLLTADLCRILDSTD